MICPCGCGTDFTPRRLHHRYASNACRYRAWAAEHRGGPRPSGPCPSTTQRYTPGLVGARVPCPACGKQVPVEPAGDGFGRLGAHRR